jgi:U3 small nucleolar RNA-associated protein 19
VRTCLPSFIEYNLNLISLLSALSSTFSSSSPPPPHYVSNLLYFLDSITKFPTDSSDLHEFWTGAPPRPSPSSSAAPPNKKRKQEEPKPVDGSTGIFDSSSSSEDEDELRDKAKTKARVPDLLSLTAHRKVFQGAWLAVFPLLRDEAEVKRVLARLHRHIMPRMRKPALLMDWLADCCDRGNAFSVRRSGALFNQSAR